MAVTQQGGPQPASTVSPAPEQVPTPELSLDQLLEQQIAQAIQPVLDEFRQDVALVMRQQGGLPAGQQPAAPAMAPRAGAQQPQRGQSAQQAQPPALSQQLSPVMGALAPVGELTSQQGEQWLQAWLATGLAALLAESSRAIVQQRAQQGLHLLLEKLFAAAPDGTSDQEIRAKTEQALQAMLRDTLGAVFAEAMRATLLREGQAAIQSAVHGDVGALLRAVEDTLKAMAEALVTALRGQRQRAIRLALALVLLALEGSLLQSDDHHARSS